MRNVDSFLSAFPKTSTRKGTGLESGSVVLGFSTFKELERPMKRSMIEISKSRFKFGPNNCLGTILNPE